MARNSYGYRRGGPMSAEEQWRGLDGDRDDLLLQPGWTSSRMSAAILAVYGCLILLLGVSFAG